MIFVACRCGSRLVNMHQHPEAGHIDVFCAVCGEFIMHLYYHDLEDYRQMDQRVKNLALEEALKKELEVEENGE